MSTGKRFLKLVGGLLATMFLVVEIFSSSNIFALSPAQRRLFDLWVPYYNTEGGTITGSGGSGGGGGGSNFDPCHPNAGGVSGDVGALMHTSITETWGISDSAVEDWFLSIRNAGVNRFGLNSSNIGAVTAAVKAAGVSPVFFYAYAVTEGSNLGGFINHWGSDTGGGAVANAARDAQYLVQASQNMNDIPSWYDYGNPVHFVPQEIQDAGNADFQSMPAGSIGRAFIPSTAAATWEVYYPDGLSKAFNGVQDYGAPLNAITNYIAQLGGSVGQGGGGSGGTGGGGGEECNPLDIDLSGIDPSTLPDPPGANDSRMSDQARNTARILNYLFPENFDVSTYFGGSVAGSCHGNWDGATISAMDLMVKGDIHSTDVRRSTEQIAEWIMNNREELNVTTIIYYDRILSAGSSARPFNEWSDYNHPSGSDDTLQHRDHIHISIGPCEG